MGPDPDGIPDDVNDDTVINELDLVNLAVVFDEVMTGFRVALEGAQGYFGVTPDLTCLGKVVGGGLPAAAAGTGGPVPPCPPMP